jgi:hypothetical protein
MGSWTYYFYALDLAVAAAASASRAAGRLTRALVALAVVGHVTFVRDSVRGWRGRT